MVQNVPAFPRLFFYFLSSWHLAQPSNGHCCTATVGLEAILKSHQQFSIFLLVCQVSHQAFLLQNLTTPWTPLVGVSQSFRLSVIESGIVWTVHFWFA